MSSSYQTSDRTSGWSRRCTSDSVRIPIRSTAAGTTSSSPTPRRPTPPPRTVPRQRQRSPRRVLERFEQRWLARECDRGPGDEGRIGSGGREPRRLGCLRRRRPDHRTAPHDTTPIREKPSRRRTRRRRTPHRPRTRPRSRDEARTRQGHAAPAKTADKPTPKDAPKAQESAPTEDTSKVLRGAAAAVAKNMGLSLEIPTATSVRAIPAKLMIDNRVVVNNHLARTRGGKISFTHIRGYAIVQAVKSFPNMNRHFAEVDGKPNAVTPRTRTSGSRSTCRARTATARWWSPRSRTARRWGSASSTPPTRTSSSAHATAS